VTTRRSHWQTKRKMVLALCGREKTFPGYLPGTTKPYVSAGRVQRGSEASVAGAFAWSSHCFRAKALSLHFSIWAAILQAPHWPPFPLLRGLVPSERRSP
jgi:hypothetical protein